MMRWRSFGSEAKTSDVFHLVKVIGRACFMCFELNAKRDGDDCDGPKTRGEVLEQLLRHRKKRNRLFEV